jgi:nitroimidazol reductase NimA-like FMN-containing flavoprotein (pyridoxamine 5'-phosphate oxidase superfamily)
MEPTTTIDTRFSDAGAEPTPWAEALATLEGAELYWITTVRADGRPHVTPLVGVVHEGEAYFCTGLAEQKGRNLQHSTKVALTTGNNTWTKGLDVVVEGDAVRVSGDDELRMLAKVWFDKYGDAWTFEVANGFFVHSGGEAAVFRIAASKVMAFRKEGRFAQTTYRFG